MTMNPTTIAPPLYPRLERAERLSDRVADQIRRLIAERELKPGERLPPERELGEAFGVSRTVIREAIRALVARGLVEVQPGNGTLVLQPSASIVADALALVIQTAPGQIRFRDAHELRCILEPQIAALAAERRTAADLLAIERELDRMRQDDADWQAADVQFHVALARAAHNPIFGIVLDSIHDILHEVRVVGYRLPDTRANGLRHHTAIFAAVAAGRAEAAHRAMVAHLRQAERTLQRAAAIAPPPPPPPGPEPA